MAVITTDMKNFSESLLRFHDLAVSLYGPSVFKVVLKNKEGARTNEISTSLDLCAYLQPKNDMLKLLLNFLKSHILIASDGGLFTTILSSNLILNSYLENFPSGIFAEGSRHVLETACDFINETKVKIDIGKLRDVFYVLKPLIVPKLRLKDNELNHLCLLFAKTFACSMSSDDVNDMNVLVNDSQEITECSLYDGFLLPLGKYPSKGVYSDEKEWKVILVSPSLSLDSEEICGDPGTKITITSLTEFKEDMLYSLLLKFCERLLPHVDMIICQKVVHASLKRFFKRNKIQCIDRVGESMIRKLSKVCGYKVVTCLSVDDIESFVGRIERHESIQVKEKYFFRIISEDNSALKTLLLCGRDESEVKRLRHCYECSLKMLRGLVSNGFVLCGGGCLETMISMHLMGTHTSRKIVEKLNCSLHMAKNLLAIVVKSLLNVAASIESNNVYFEHVIDLAFHHHWINISTASSCCCGLISKKDLKTRFIKFYEVLHLSSLDECFSSNRVVENHLSSALYSFVCHPLDVYRNNMRASFEAAETLLRIGCSVIHK